MKRQIVPSIAASLLFLSAIAFAEYSITSSILSGGGGTATGSIYASSSTTGQPSPLATGAGAVVSENYQNRPGFWPTLSDGSADSCLYDYNLDGDVDGLDLAEFISGATIPADPSGLAVEFGRIDCTASF